MSTATITQTLRLMVVRPLDGDWDALGGMLRALRAPLHRVLNGIVRELELGPRDGVAQWEPSPKDSLAGWSTCHPQTAGYRYARDLWLREREEAAARVAKGKPYTGDDRIASTTPTSACVLGAAGAAYARWQKYQKDKWKGTTSLPSFRGDSPIYVVGAGVEFRCDDGRDILSLHLSGDWTDLIVSVDGGSAHANLGRIRSGSVKLGDVRLVNRDGRWQAMLAFTSAAPLVEPGRTIAVHRGVRTFLSFAASRSRDDARDARCGTLADGDDITRHKDGYRARRRSLGRHTRELGTGAKGHGTARRFECITRLEDAEARWVRSKCQNVAAGLCRVAERMGATRILLEDWTNPAKDGAPELGVFLEYKVRSFPLAELRGAIEWSAKKRGYTVESVRTDNNSRDCPSCGHRHDAAQFGTFLCANCRLERPADIIFAWNMLRRDGKPPGIDESKQALKRAAGRLRGRKAKKAA